MPLPATPFRTTERTWSGRAADNHGPWEYNGALYACFYDDVNSVPNMYKSTDDGDTWSVVDAQLSANWPNQNGANTITYGGWSFDRYNDVIYVARAWTHTSGFPTTVRKYRIGKFDLATETWTPKISDDTTSPSNTSNALATEPFMRGAFVLRIRQTDGAPFLAYYELGGSGTCKIVKLDNSGATWTWETPIDTALTEAYPVGGVTTSNGRIHWFIGAYTQAEYTTSGDPQASHLHHVALKTDDTLGTITEMYDEVHRDIEEGIGVPVLNEDGTLAITVGCTPSVSPSPGGSFAIRLFTASEAEVPTWSNEELPLPVSGTDSGDFFAGHTSWKHVWASPFYFDGKWNVLAATNETDNGSDYYGSLWRLIKDGTWSYEKLYDTSDKTLNDWLLGSAIGALITGGFGFFFNAHGNAYEDTEDYYVSISLDAAVIRYSYFTHLRGSSGSITGGSRFSLFG